eukprot:3060376-Prymnesium_polylepis.1
MVPPAAAQVAPTISAERNVPVAAAPAGADAVEWPDPIFEVPTAPFHVYLGSNTPREGDLSSCMAHATNGTEVVVNIDRRRGGYSHDWSQPGVCRALAALVSQPHCRGVI